MEQLLSIWLLQFSSLSHIIEKIASSTELDNEDDVFITFICFIELDHILMSCPLNNSHFLHHLLPLSLILHPLLVDRFHGEQLPAELVHAEVHFTECALSQSSSDLIKLRIRLGWLPMFTKVMSYLPDQLIDLFGSRTQVFELSVLHCEEKIGGDGIEVRALFDFFLLEVQLLTLIKLLLDDLLQLLLLQVLLLLLHITFKVACFSFVSRFPRLQHFMSALRLSNLLFLHHRLLRLISLHWLHDLNGFFEVG